MGRYFPNTQLRTPLIVAECGNNHEGSMDAALKLLDAAVEAGASLVKFQAGTAEGFARNADEVERYKPYALGWRNYNRLYERGKELGVPVFFSVWGHSEGFQALRRLEFLKIAARQFGKYLYLDNPKMFVSVPHTYSGDYPYEHAIPLHCVSEYPATNPHLERILSLANVWTRYIGYSDHTVGIDACIEAAGLGAIVIEKHFTLSHDFGLLRDHKLSATPEELKKLVEEVRRYRD